MMQMLLWMTIAFCWMTVGLACRCLQPTPAVTDYCQKDIVFRGRPVAVYGTNAPSRIYTFEVDEIFWSKRSFAGRTRLNVTTSNNSCGEHFGLNIPFVIAATELNGQLSTSLCSGNKQWNSLDINLQRLPQTSYEQLCTSINNFNQAVAQRS
ncbi:uncharacterized protein LOC112560855 [Pomacea canaliculata]|uniref:uncharacterized protein LOC112560855 n=1 Tax=Pomacea canaliculata TaxID=400727 RepID=UPI000D73CD40|nr:uncharacterized protein LOC112560855 [Pomacea canaliculata]